MSVELGLGVRPAVRRARDWVRRRPAVVRGARELPAAGEGISYLGFAGQRNIGDDAILEAHQRWTLGRPVNQLPVHHVPEVLSRARAAGPNPVLLGGGTLVGRADWLARVKAFDGAGLASSWSLMGVGVEDPTFSGRRVHASWDDLKAWADVLPTFGEVTVRGPLSQGILAEVGVDSRVVGDPALFFAHDRVPVETDGDLVGMSVAVPEDVWGGDPGAVVTALSEAARLLVQQGRRVRLLAMHPADLAPSEAVARAVGRGEAVEVLSPPTTDDFVSAVRDCSVVVGQRLHAVVLASAVGVPSLAIEYRPKCLDFQLSIDRGDWTLSTRGLDAGDVVERAQELLEQRDEHSAAVQVGVARLVGELSADAVRVRRRVGLDRDGSA
ncbi:polysaccharide pyruvyl transferase family protein [Kineococcus sp. NPDC059986]|uniref:polysaccharide pyruvyl transferase family protein n=1 Tax=Kineococcus sp. NPDC059986 TaxID=3155538 RepID=UPI003450592B